MSLHLWLIYAVTVCVLSMTPGPCMLLAATHGLAHGRRRTLITTAGSIMALLLMIIASALGLGAILAASETAFSVLKWIGAAYLIYLGIKTWRSPGDHVGLHTRTVGRAQATAWQLFRQGFWVALSNPKAIIFFGALFPQFVDVTLPQFPQYLVLTVTFVAGEVFWQMMYAFGGARLAQRLGPGGWGKALNRLSGGTFVGLGALLSAAHR